MLAALARAPLAALLACTFAAALSPPARGEATWTTYHRDPARSGADPEAGNLLTPSLAWQSPPLGAPIYGQPLVLGARVYVATVGDRIYSLEVSSGKVIWEKSAGVPVPSGELPCGNISPTVGIVGTPVIDTSTNAIYAVADSWDASKKEAHHVLKGYALGGGEEVLSTPVDPPGSDPKAQLQRTALNLDKGSVIFGLGGNDGDCSDYRGMVVSVPERGGSPSYWIYQPAPPSTSGGAVWGASGPAVDGEGHIYVATGNPNPGSQKAETYDYSDSVIELQATLSQSGYFKPESWLVDSNNDTDLGSAGPELLPGGVLFQSGKNDIGYLISEATMSSGAPALYSHQVCSGAGSFGGDAFANGTIYVPCADGTRALSYNQSAHSFSELWRGPSEAIGSPILSAGLVWVPSTPFQGGGGTTLYGLEAATGKARYTVTLPSRVADHFASPSAAAGRLFLATGSSVSAYRIAQPAAVVSTDAATSIAQTSATLHASVDPNGFEVSECHFEYGPTTAYGSSAPCTPSPGSGESPVAVSAAIGGLTANTTYHFRISATSAGGTSKGTDQTFKTLSRPPPTLVTEAASPVAQTSATLHASVNPNGSEVTDCHFEYGTTTSYGASAPCTPSPGSGTSAVPVSAALESLSENSTYHFRISATSALGGLSFGSDRTFTTTLMLGPHWYANNVRLGESALENGLIVMGWGYLTLANSSLGAFTCQTLAGGDIANPVGGGAGKGSFESFAFYDCVAPACEAVKGLLQVIPEKLDWSSVLTEEAGVFRDRIEGISIRAICVGGTSNVEFHGTLKPELEAGTTQGAAPARLEFGAGSGSLTSSEGAGNPSARLKFMGFEGGEMIRAAKT